MLSHPGSGLLAYPGKLKRWLVTNWLAAASRFRITRLSGEVETRFRTRRPGEQFSAAFRITRLSGEVETRHRGPAAPCLQLGSGLLAYPGKLKLKHGERCGGGIACGSGLLAYPRKLKRGPDRLGQRGGGGSGLLAYPGKLKLDHLLLAWQ